MVWMHTCTRFTSIVMNTWSCICTMCLCMCIYDVHHCMIYSAALWSRVILILIFTNYNAPLYGSTMDVHVYVCIYKPLFLIIFIYAHQIPHHTACVVNSYGHNIQDLFWHAFIIISALLVSRHLCHNSYYIETSSKRKAAESFWLENKFVPTCNTFGNLVKLLQQEEFLVTMHMKATVTLVNWNSVHPTQMDFPSMIDPAKIKQLLM